MHVPLFEMPFYNGGGVPPVVETPLGRIGITIDVSQELGGGAMARVRPSSTPSASGAPSCTDALAAGRL